MAGGGKVYSLVLLMALLGLFHPATMLSLNPELMSAFGVSRANGPCCQCACAVLDPNICLCLGQWEGACPSVCKNCNCDENNRCRCIAVMEYNDCMSNSCSYNGASGGAHKGM